MRNSKDWNEISRTIFSIEINIKYLRSIEIMSIGMHYYAWNTSCHRINIYSSLKSIINSDIPSHVLSCRSLRASSFSATSAVSLSNSWDFNSRGCNGLVVSARAISFSSCRKASNVCRSMAIWKVNLQRDHYVDIIDSILIRDEKNNIELSSHSSKILALGCIN